MNNWPITLVTGIVLVCFGGMMIRAHRKSWQIDRFDEKLSDEQRKHTYRKYRRRMQTSSILVILGFLLPLGHFVIPWNKQKPLAESIFWLSVLCLLLWVILMAMADMLSIRMRGMADLNEVKRKRMILEEQIRQIRKKSSNGKPHR